MLKMLSDVDIWILQIGTEGDYGVDTTNDDYGNIIPCVIIPLESTDALDMEADALRMEAGHLPFFREDGDLNGWYAFSVAVDRTGVGDYILAEPVNADDHDHDAYYIPLTQRNRWELWNVLASRLAERNETYHSLFEWAKNEL